MSKSIAILGAGESGTGAAILGVKHGYSVFLSDAGSIGEDSKRILSAHGVDFEEGGHSSERILAVDEIVKSPGIPEKVSLVKEAVNKGVPVISEIELAYRHIPDNARVIAITGTNGKTTTTLLTYHLLKSAGYNVALGGNVGVSLAKLVAEGGYDYYVVEVSSFQLDGIVDFKPDVAVLLNITPDHLDRYAYDFQKYVASKFRITENLEQGDCFIYCADSEPITEAMTGRKMNGSVFAVSTTNNPKWSAYQDKSHLVFNYKEANYKVPVSEIPLIGKHNMLNTMASVLNALIMDVSIEKIISGLKTFKNAPHRMEPCGELDGVKYINDSKATNVDSVYYALDGIGQNIIWIAGGIDKGNDYGQIKELVKEKVKGLVCLGMDNSPLTSYFASVLIQIKETTDIREAVKMANELASPGDVVLLSPACASFDLFKNYEDRGDQFKQAVNAMVTTKEARI